MLNSLKTNARSILITIFLAILATAIYLAYLIYIGIPNTQKHLLQGDTTTQQ